MSGFALPPATRDILRDAFDREEGPHEECWDRIAQMVQPCVGRAARGPLARRYVRDHLEQIALFAVVRALPRFHYEGAGSLERWVKVVARNALATLARKEIPRDAHESAAQTIAVSRLGIPSDSRSAGGRTALRIESREEERRRLRDGLALLSDRERRVVQLRQLEGVSVAETVRRMGLSERKIARVQLAAIKKLRTFLEGPS